VRILTALLLLLPVTASAAQQDDLSAMMKTLPRAVRAFVERKSECNHWAGEEPYDAARAKQIERAVTRLNCEKLDREEAVLKRRHAGNRKILEALALAARLYQ
jgi:hypothetical protein